MGGGNYAGAEHLVSCRGMARTAYAGIRRLCDRVPNQRTTPDQRMLRQRGLNGLGRHAFVAARRQAVRDTRTPGSTRAIDWSLEES